MKIGTRLLLWYGGIVIVAVPVFSASTYFGVRHVMFESLQNEHELVITAVENHFDATTGTFKNIAEDHLYLNLNMEEAYMVVFDANGEPIFRSPMANMIQLSVPLAKDQPEIVTIITQDPDALPLFHLASSDHVRFHAVSKKLYHDGKLVGWVNLASSLDDTDRALRALLQTLFVAKALSLGILLGGGIFITRSSLKPVAAITKKAREITAKNLGERIEVVNKNDEIGQLAIVLNSLLDRLQRAFDSQQRFLADAAHELKTPVAILRTQWEDELNNPQLPDDFKEKLVGDIETITRLTRVINSLLLLSQTEAVTKSFDFAPVRWDEVVKDVVADTLVLAGMKRQTIEFDRVQDAVVDGDHDRLYQLVFNLIDNAVKYTPDGGKITVSLTIESRFAVLEIQNTGQGIPEEDIPHVFDRFFRVDRDRSRKTGGSGLGLAICKMIAETHRGRIVVASKPGEGTVFTVRLPLRPPA